MIINLTGGPLDGQQKNVKQPTDGSILGNLLPMYETLTWPIWNSGSRHYTHAKYAKQTEGSKHQPAEYSYEV